MPGFQKPLVAVADDFPGKLDGYRSILHLMGCEAQVFESGEDFLAHADRDRIACVVLNEQMKRLSGHETFHAMRKDGWNIPVISESAHPPEEILASYEYGQVAHLYCPWRLAEFENAIRKGLSAAGYCLAPKGVIVFDLDILSWNGGTIPKLARNISEEQAFDDLPVVGDALEEAGCMNADMLNHCRHPEKHFRGGCWVLQYIQAMLLPENRFDVLVCEECKQHLRVPNHLGDLRVQCPRCKHGFEWTLKLSVLFY